jgi:hypothetical protein
MAYLRTTTHCVALPGGEGYRTAHACQLANIQKERAMLRIYVAADCPSSSISQHLIERLHECYPHVPLAVIDVSDPHAEIPEQIFATPIYTWNDQILFLGNPSEETLLEQVRRLYDQEYETRQRTRDRFSP